MDTSAVKVNSRGPQRVGLSKHFLGKPIPSNESEPDSVGMELNNVVESKLNDEGHRPTIGLSAESNDAKSVLNDDKSEDFQLTLDSSFGSGSDTRNENDDKELETLSDDSGEFTGFHENFTPQIKPFIKIMDITKLIAKVENELLAEALNIPIPDYNMNGDTATKSDIPMTNKKEYLENSDKENSFRDHTSSDQGEKKAADRLTGKRKKSESADTSFDNMKLLSQVSSGVTDSHDSTKGDSGNNGMEVSRLDSDIPTQRNSKTFSNRHSGTESPAMASGRRSIKRTSTLDLSNPIFRKPFEFGWKRELVYRNSNDMSTKIQADVYYYTPKNKKIRSNREVSEHLHNTELTTENFTFFKDSLGVDDPSKEIIRSAAQRSSIGGEGFIPVKKSPKKKEVKEVKTPKEPKVPKVPKEPRPPKEDSPEISSPVFGPKASIGPRKGVFPRIKVTPLKAPTQKTAGGGNKTKKANHDGDMEMGMLPPSWNPSANKAKLQPCSIRCIGVMGLIPSLQCRLCLCLYHPECVGLGTVSNAIHSYVCKNCQHDLKEGKSKGSGSPSCKNSPPPLTPISSLTNHNAKLEGGKKLPIGAPIPSPPKLQRYPEPARLTTVPKYVKVTPTQEGISSSIVKTYRAKGQPMVGGVTTWLPPSSTIQLNTNNNTSSLPSTTSAATTAGEVDSAPAVQTIMNVCGKKYIVVQKNNIVSISNPSSPVLSSATRTGGDSPEKPKVTTAGSTPGSGKSQGQGLVTGQSLLMTRDQGMSLVQAVGNQTPGPGGPILPKPATFFMGNSSGGAQNPAGVLLVPCFQNPSLLPNQKDSTSQGGQPQQFILVNGPAGNFVFGGIQGQVQNDMAATTAADDEKITATAKRNAESDEGPSSPKRPKLEDVKVEKSSIMQNFVSNVAEGYNALLQVFQYLKTQELLRAARVCKMWRDLAGHRSLWRTVRLKNSHVDDWQGLTEALARHGTQHLDLRKMVLPTDIPENEQMWRDFSQGIAKAHALTRIDLCRCPPFVVEDLGLACPQLITLNALTIKCSVINLTPLSNLKNLTELRLKSMTGTKLEKNLKPIRELINLKYLALTTIKEIGQAGCEHFKYLTNLETFELGECVDLPENFGEEVLMKLPKLERLRLEKGQGTGCHTFRLLAAIKEIPKLNQLELINFDIKIGFDTALSHCSNIKRLLLIPTYVTQSATTNYLILAGATKLKATLSHFVWGVTTELLRVTELFVDQCDSTGSKSPVRSKKDSKSSESIPILKSGTLDRVENLENFSKEELKDGKSPGQVEIQTVYKLTKHLNAALPNTRVKIVKIPFLSTWKQTIADPSHH